MAYHLNLKPLFYLLITFILSACNGPSDDNESKESIEIGDVKLTLALFSDNCPNNCKQFSNQETITAKAKLTRQGVPVTGEIIEFSATIGLLSATSRITDEDGYAAVTLVNQGTDLIAGELTASRDLISIDSTFEFIPYLGDQPQPAANFNLTASVFNVEAADYAGTSTLLTVYASDRNNNPLPSGTLVNFETEGGIIEPSCILDNGSCSVNWLSSGVVPNNHRISILATTTGEEYFTDNNENGYRDSNENYTDLAEAYLDINENNRYDLGEPFIDLNEDNTYNFADGLYNGPNCNADCATSTTASLSSQLVIISSGSDAKLRLTRNDITETLLSTESGNIITAPLTLAVGNSLNLNLIYADFSDQILPAGTAITVTSTIGEATLAYFVPNTIGSSIDHNQFGNYQVNFIFDAVDAEAGQGVLTLTIDTPNADAVLYYIDVILN